MLANEIICKISKKIIRIPRPPTHRNSCHLFYPTFSGISSFLIWDAVEPRDVHVLYGGLLFSFCKIPTFTASLLLVCPILYCFRFIFYICDHLLYKVGAALFLRFKSLSWVSLRGPGVHWGSRWVNSGLFMVLRCSRHLDSSFSSDRWEVTWCAFNFKWFSFVLNKFFCFPVKSEGRSCCKTSLTSQIFLHLSTML